MKTRYFLFLSGVFLTGFFALAVDAPTSGTANSAGPATIALSWSDVSGETGYKVYRDTALVATVLANTTHYYDRGLSPSTTYSYQVSAIDGGSESALTSLGSASTTIKMNIIFFFADDMGPKDIVGLRNPEIDGASIHETPALDTLADEGIVFNNCYASGPRCVVARRALLTGRYDWREDNYTSSASGLAPAVVTFGDAVKSAGYRTCYIGKYHLGESSEFPANGPKEQGFDVQIGSGHKGSPAANAVNDLAYFPNPSTLLYNTLSGVDYNMGAGQGLNAPASSAGEYLTDRLTDEAIGFINDSITNYTAQPFFLTLAHYAVHTAIEAKQSDVNYFAARKTAMSADLAAHPQAATPLLTDLPTQLRQIQDNIVYAAMVKSYDDSLAALRAHLNATDDPRNPGKKLSETTIIVISADHGSKADNASWSGKSLENDAIDTPVTYSNFPVTPAPSNPYQNYPASNYPFRHGKTWVYEGGIKIPLIVYYPGLTSSGSISEALVHGADFFASFADMAGAAQQPGEAVDSISFMLSTAKPAASARKKSFHWFTNTQTGTANFCLGALRIGDYKLLYFGVQRKMELYNLAADLYERNDLSASRPDLAEEMKEELYQYVVDTEKKLPQPGNGTWKSEQEILVRSGLVSPLPAPPDAAPTWNGGSPVIQLSPSTVQITWDVNASNADYSVILRKDPDKNYTREIAYIPVVEGLTTYTFVDRNLTPGGTYKYVVESENLGGWHGWVEDASGWFSDGSSVDGTSNTGKKSITLTVGANYPISAVDDTITTVPGELRVFNPRVNDEGEGALSITSITAPSDGATAWTDGQLIYYEAPESFIGSVTLTYTLGDDASQSDTATVTINLPVQPTTSTDLGTWQFNEASADLEDTTSSSGLSFGGNTTHSTTDGSDLVLTGPATADMAQNTGALSGAPYNSGRFQMEYHISAVDFSTSAATLANNVGFTFRDKTAGEDFGIIRVRENSGKIRFEIRTVGNNPLYTFSDATASNLTVRAILDLDTRKFYTEISLDGGSSFTTLSEVDVNPDAVNLEVIRATSSQSTYDAADFAKIDYLAISKLENPVSLYESWASAYAWNGVLERDPSDDPDGDGISNFAEFAFGGLPTESSTNIPLIATRNADAVVQFTPLRDTSILNYTLQFTTNLITPAWSSQSITNPAGALVEEAFPAGKTVYGRVTASE